MNLLQLDIFNFRNIEKLNIKLSNNINVLSGSNGAGKTSVLEAVHHLSLGKSFRTNVHAKLIQFDKEAFIIRGELANHLNLAIQKSRSKKTVVKLNQEIIHSASQLAKYLPTIVIHEQLFSIIDSGPNERRALLDWGVFHVEHNYQHNYQKYKKALFNRNLLIKKNCKDSYLLSTWEYAMAESAYAIHKLRETYLKSIIKPFTKILSLLKPELHVSLSYLHGWGQDIKTLDQGTILELLKDSRTVDLERGYTTKGAQKADIKINYEMSTVKGVLSRGQQKSVLLAIKFAQMNLIGNKAVLLIDDLAAELDQNTLINVCEYIKSQSIQAILTTLDDGLEPIKAMADKWFHVKHGQVF